MKASDLLREKGSTVVTIPPSATVADAVAALSTHNIGAVLVSDESRIHGVLSERDVVRLLAGGDPKTLLAKPVTEVMVRNIVIGTPDTTLDDVMAFMTKKHIRHVPIIEQGKLVGIISIGDAVKAQIRNANTEIHYLREYMSGRHPATPGQTP